MEENRKYVRFKAPFCVQYTSESLKEEVPGVIKDISMGGIRVLLYTNYNVPADSIAFFSILLPENTLQVSARVVWSQLEGEKE
ncbi:MAG: hypothetical protein GF375_06785, partial [Candidatus Omnitrophica bacterium]|nr:hypothetical protein [Candidatus Omnitrophota bacterium]MBD3269681.1 hypothetical protein [Candidatus Omnitrophota bacterium]